MSDETTAGKGKKKRNRKCREEDSIDEFMVVAYSTLLDLEADGPTRPETKQLLSSGTKRKPGPRKSKTIKKEDEEDKEWSLRPKKKATSKRKKYDEETPSTPEETVQEISSRNMLSPSCSVYLKDRKENSSPLSPISTNIQVMDTSTKTTGINIEIKPEPPEKITTAEIAISAANIIKVTNTNANMGIATPKEKTEPQQIAQPIMITQPIAQPVMTVSTTQTATLTAQQQQPLSFKKLLETTSSSDVKSPAEKMKAALTDNNGASKHVITKESEFKTDDGITQHRELRQERITFESTPSSTNNMKTSPKAQQQKDISKHVHEHRHQHQHQHQHFHPPPTFSMPPGQHMFYPGMPYIIPSHLPTHQPTPTHQPVPPPTHHPTPPTLLVKQPKVQRNFKWSTMHIQIAKFIQHRNDNVAFKKPSPDLHRAHRPGFHAFQAFTPPKAAGGEQYSRSQSSLHTSAFGSSLPHPHTPGSRTRPMMQHLLTSPTRDDRPTLFKGSNNSRLHSSASIRPDYHNTFAASLNSSYREQLLKNSTMPGLLSPQNSKSFLRTMVQEEKPQLLPEDVRHRERGGLDASTERRHVSSMDRTPYHNPLHLDLLERGSTLYRDILPRNNSPPPGSSQSTLLRSLSPRGGGAYQQPPHMRPRSPIAATPQGGLLKTMESPFDLDKGSRVLTRHEIPPLISGRHELPMRRHEPALIRHETSRNIGHPNMLRNVDPSLEHKPLYDTARVYPRHDVLSSRHDVMPRHGIPSHQHLTNFGSPASSGKPRYPSHRI